MHAQSDSNFWSIRHAVIVSRCRILCIVCIAAMLTDIDTDSDTDIGCGINKAS